MYVPNAYQVEDLTQLVDFIRSYPFATLVTRQTNLQKPPVATHLPLITQLDEGGGIRLIGHFARANLQWNQIESTQSLAIFQGPHAYISPAWYGDQNVVPTWNYVSVHVSGTCRILNDPKDALQSLRTLVVLNEKLQTMPWSMDSADSVFIEGLLNSIVVFEMTAVDIQGCWKLNQHHSQSRRSNTVKGLLQRGNPDDIAIARLMEASMKSSTKDAACDS